MPRLERLGGRVSSAALVEQLWVVVKRSFRWQFMCICAYVNGHRYDSATRQGVHALPNSRRYAHMDVAIAGDPVYGRAYRQGVWRHDKRAADFHRTSLDRTGLGRAGDVARIHHEVPALRTRKIVWSLSQGRRP